MKNKQFTYLSLIILHILIGIVVFLIPFLAKLYSGLIIVLGIVLMLKTRNRNNEALLISSYVVGVEVFLRMTGGNPIHELSKYLVIFFMVFGMFYKGFSRSSYVYVFFLLLLVPGVIIGATELSFDTNIRKAIAFNISGPVCLAIASIYCYQRFITIDNVIQILIFIGLPIISMSVYLFLYNPNVKDVVTGTQSNFETSGGFGPNQVSTVLGLGMFVFFALFLLYSNSKKTLILNIGLTVLIAYRGIVTFSRGGVLTGLVMIVCLLIVLYLTSSKKLKSKIIGISLFFIIGGGIVWSYSIYATNGMIEYRYANKDARGREKADRLGGREAISGTEIKAFFENPIFGIGVGKNAEYRKEIIGVKVSSHNEISRMLADHGSFGVVGLLLLIITPLLIFFNKSQNIFLLSFFIFWALTINHAAMRIAAPAFVYALSLLKVTFVDEKETVISRK